MSARVLINTCHLLTWTTLVPPSASTPTDLRELLKPLNSRLSPAFAGSNGNEEGDIETIKDYWLRGVLDQKVAEYAEMSNIK